MIFFSELLRKKLVSKPFWTIWSATKYMAKSEPHVVFKNMSILKKIPWFINRLIKVIIHCESWFYTSGETPIKPA